MMIGPVSRVFGSKARVADQLLALVPPTRIWVEVFAGSAALTIAKRPHHSEHLNDLDGDIVTLFAVLRDPETRERLVHAVEFSPWSEEEFRLLQAARDDGAELDAVERARRYLVRSWQGRAGDVPNRTGWAADRRANRPRPLVWASLPYRIAAVGERLKAVHVHRAPAIEMVERFAEDRDACLFVDPPYPRSAIDSHGAVYRLEMSDLEHDELARVLARVERAKVILTMAPDTIYDRTLAGWWRLPLQVRGLRNGVKEESVFLNFDPMSTGLFA